MLHQLAVHLRPRVPAGGIGSDLSIIGQVEHGREQTWVTEDTHVGLDTDDNRY